MTPAGWIAAGLAAGGGAAAAVVGLLGWATRRAIRRASAPVRAELEELLTPLGEPGPPPPAGEPAWLRETTLCIKTFQRPRCVARLVTSAKRRYPALRIRVADDSCEPLFAYGWSRGGVTWHALPYDSGISAGRNHLADAVETPFVVFCDDDKIFTEATDLGRLHEVLVRSGYDLIAAGSGRQSRVRFRRAGDRLWIEEGAERPEIEPGVFESDRTPNFFITRTERVRALRWADELKLLEHTEFFYRAWRDGWKVAEIPEVVSRHDAGSCLPAGRWLAWLTYRRFRGRVRWASRIVRRLTGRPYLPSFERDGLRRVKTVRVA